VKSYSLRAFNLADDKSPVLLIEVKKISEWPDFAPPTPARLQRLIQPDRDLFLKGRRAEIAGLGIGAFGYYRRIIEQQKNRLFDEVIRVAKHLGAQESDIAILEGAKNDTQFSKAVEMAKGAIPRSLFISGHNPLSLLHSALSEGLHARTDGECLAVANDIRLVLVEFAEQLGEAMKDRRELNDAVSRLMNRQRPGNAGLLAENSK
jgi:hypothetical protein